MHPAAELAPRPAHVLPDLPTRIKRCARDAGFDLCGIAPVRDFAELRVFPAWIADGKHGEMKYMEARDEAGELKRASLARVAPWARSVIVCAINYNTAHPYSTQAQERRCQPRLDFALRLVPRGLPRRRPAPPETSRRRVARTTRRNWQLAAGNWQLAIPFLRRHRPAHRARIRQIRWHRMDRQEHLRHQSAAWIVAVSGRDPDLARFRGR